MNEKRKLCNSFTQTDQFQESSCIVSNQSNNLITNNIPRSNIQDTNVFNHPMNKINSNDSTYLALESFNLNFNKNTQEREKPKLKENAINKRKK